MELVAFRGANWHFPENTMPAFRRALQDGATVLEMDVHRTKDDFIVVCHRPSRHGKRISKTRYESLAHELPNFEDVLIAFPTTRFNVDIESKDIGTVYRVVELIKKHHSVSRVCLTSYHLEVHRWLNDLKYEGERGLSSLELLWVFMLPVSFLKTLGLSGRRAQVPLRSGPVQFAGSYFIEKCHSLGVQVDFWVVNQLETAKKLVALGADRIMTDDPATLVSLSSA